MSFRFSCHHNSSENGKAETKTTLPVVAVNAVAQASIMVDVLESRR
jgi:hypothetical protein